METRSSATTTISRTTPGTAVQVKTKSNANAPLAVNGTGKVTNLNVDKVDGFDGGTRALTWTYTGSVETGRNFRLAGLPAGSLLISWDAYIRTTELEDGIAADCYLRVDPASGSLRYAAEDTGTNDTAYGIALSSTGLITHAANDPVDLICRHGGGVAWRPFNDQPIKITAVPLAAVTDRGAPLNPELLRVTAKK